MRDKLSKRDTNRLTALLYCILLPDDADAFSMTFSGHHSMLKMGIQKDNSHIGGSDYPRANVTHLNVHVFAVLLADVKTGCVQQVPRDPRLPGVPGRGGRQGEREARYSTVPLKRAGGSFGFCFGVFARGHRRLRLGARYRAKYIQQDVQESGLRRGKPPGGPIFIDLLSYIVGLVPAVEGSFVPRSFLLDAMKTTSN